MIAVSLLAGCNLSRDHPALPLSIDFYDDFTARSSGGLTVGSMSDSGHTYSVLGQIPWEIRNGRLTNQQTNPDLAQSSYLGVDLARKQGDRIASIWAEYEVPAGQEPQESIVLIISDQEFTVPGYEFADSAAHCAFTGDSFRYDTLKALNPGLGTDVLGRGHYSGTIPGIYRIEIEIRDEFATVIAPDGSEWKFKDESIRENSGSWATIQLYNQGDGQTRKALGILRWGAELQQ